MYSSNTTGQVVNLDISDTFGQVRHNSSLIPMVFGIQLLKANLPQGTPAVAHKGELWLASRVTQGKQIHGEGTSPLKAVKAN